MKSAKTKQPWKKPEVREVRVSMESTAYSAEAAR